MTSVTTVPTEADWVAATRLGHLVRLRRRSGRLRWLALAVAGLAAALAYLAWAGDGVDWWGVGLIAWLVVVIPLGVAINLLLVPRRIRRMVAQQPAFAEPMTFVWTTEGFGIRSALSTSNIRWDQLVGWTESRACFLVYVTDDHTLFVPKGALSPSETDEWRALLAAGVPAR